jgi:protein-S-isoprenylcysteine O-methyltransferase Ste14
MLISSALLFPIVLDGETGRLEGIILFGFLLIFLVYLVRTEPERKKVEAEFAAEYGAGSARVGCWA